ncbi:MAG: TonB-dependent receptor [Saprospiraceae bacterium]
MSEKIYIHWLLLAITIMIGGGLSAQSATLMGTVTATESGQPIKGATVFLTATNQSIVTNHMGQFSLPALTIGRYHVTVFATGFSTVQKEIMLDQQETFMEINMAPLSYNLDVVQIQGDKGEEIYGLRSLRNVEGVGIYAAKKSEVIELDNMVANLASNNAREIYKGIAGLNIWENDGAGLQLAIGARGLDPNRSSNFNTRQNGYDISADALGYPESYYTPPAQALQRIEIVRGAASLQYGTQFGGLLNFVFRDGPEDKVFEFNSEQTLGSFNFFNSFNSIGGTKGKVNYYGFYQYKQGDGWRANSGFEQQTGFARIGLKLSDRFQMGIEFTQMNYLAQQAGGLVDFEFKQNPQQSKRERNWFDVNWNLAAFTLDYRLSDRTRLNVRNFLLLARRSALGDLGPTNRPDPLRERDLIIGTYQNFGNETRLIHRYDLGNQLATFLIGLRYYQGYTHNQQGDANDGKEPDFQFLHPDDLEKSDYEFPSRNVALFAENLFNISPRFSLTPGIRMEYIRTASEGYFKQRVFSGNQVIFEQRFEDAKVNERTFALLGLGASYKTNDKIESYANFSQNYRAINFSDLAVVNPNLEIDSLLKDESGFNLDVGIRGNTLANRLRFDCSIFYLQYNDRIGTAEKEVVQFFGDIPVTSAVAYRTNVGDARIIGLEAFAEADLWKFVFGTSSKPALNLFANLSLLQGKYLSGQAIFVGKQVELIPPISLKTGLNFSYQRWGISYQFTYVSEHFSDATNAVMVANATRGIIPSYQVMDASLRYQWPSYRLQIGVNNLTNEAYFTRRATGYPGPGIIPAEGRRFYASLQMKL